MGADVKGRLPQINKKVLRPFIHRPGRKYELRVQVRSRVYTKGRIGRLGLDSLKFRWDEDRDPDSQDLTLDSGTVTRVVNNPKREVLFGREVSECQGKRTGHRKRRVFN